MRFDGDSRKGLWKTRLLTGFSLFVAVAATVLAVIALNPDWSQSVNRSLKREGTGGAFVTRISLSGTRHVTREQLESALGVTEGSPLGGFEPEMARARLQRLGWVASARVERHMNGHIDVRIIERIPQAVWQLSGRFHLVDESGTVLQGEVRSIPKGLPLLVGPGANRAAAGARVIAAKAPTLARAVTAWVRVAGRRWDVTFATGQRLMLPEDDYAVDAFARFASLEEEHQLLKRAVDIYDMRTPGKMVATLSSDGKKPVEKNAEPT